MAIVGISRWDGRAADDMLPQLRDPFFLAVERQRVKAHRWQKRKREATPFCLALRIARLIRAEIRLTVADALDRKGARP